MTRTKSSNTIFILFAPKVAYKIAWEITIIIFVSVTVYRYWYIIHNVTFYIYNYSIHIYAVVNIYCLSIFPLFHLRRFTCSPFTVETLSSLALQELLTQNNVVIIEPVRTKIEPLSNKSQDSSILTCKITAGANKLGEKKRHFFYHPIRVNKELLDEELPTPDTVRNAKKLFEETLLFCPMKKNQSRSMIGLNESYKNADRKYLTLEKFNSNKTGGVDTHGIAYSNSAGNGVVCGRIKKWDSSSLSSGISSGDLSSPCDCTDNDDTKLLSNESGNELCESYYVSQVREYRKTNAVRLVVSQNTSQSKQKLFSHFIDNLLKIACKHETNAD